MSTRAYVIQCDACGSPRGDARFFCRSCRVMLSDPGHTTYAASRWSRLGGYVLDYAILNLTFGIGWVIWHIFTSRNGQSPGKALIRMRVHRTNGTQATIGLMWLRDFWWDLALGLIMGLIAFVVFAGSDPNDGPSLLLLLVISFIPAAIDAAVLLLDADNRSLRDKVFNTVVTEARPPEPPIAPPPGSLPPDR